jgi:hypothetical protein
VRARGGQGQSALTIDKERRIGAATSVGMRIGNGKFGGRGFSYFHFDANAGSGWNEQVDVPGSPLVAWVAARECLPGMRFRPYFCDHDPEKMRLLRDALGADPVAAERSVLICDRNEAGLEQFAAAIRASGERPELAVGSVLVDPNGWFYETQCPVAGLVRFCREFPRVDVVLNLNRRTYEMQRACGHAVLSPREVLLQLGKQHWLVCAAAAGQSRFLLAVGRNVQTGAHDATSERGRLILDGKPDLQTCLDLGPMPATSRKRKAGHD